VSLAKFVLQVFRVGEANKILCIRGDNRLTRLKRLILSPAPLPILGGGWGKIIQISR
jgi:hypothetical protein